MSEQNQARVKTSHAIEEFTRNLGSTTLKFCTNQLGIRWISELRKYFGAPYVYHNRRQLRFTIHGNKVEVLSWTVFCVKTWEIIILRLFSSIGIVEDFTGQSKEMIVFPWAHKPI
ncbi:hypothetical protein GGX14DRAFT_387390 [Mycena pura]|uniref:Uncharacterized protein n=1 Tax=Mycena pura TaxID=153505 RepID=A0AAD6YLA0_9AGAR|nr:hypothetical protein GGX14DRAFT_387390 [Mycena pura]